jgi:phage terminase large subunit-like protein
MKKRTTRPSASSSDPATKYAQDVFDGKIVAGPHVRDACERHLQDLDYGAKRGLRWDVPAVKHAIAFFEEVLRLNGGEFEGKPFEVNGWESFVLGSLFGWKKGDYRRFRTAYIETGKGSGKSPLAAGIGLLMLSGDGEARAEVYAAAVRQEQAKVLFRDAVAMVRLSPKLQQKLTLSGGMDSDNIAFIEKGSFFRPISSERQGRGHSGPRPHAVLLDEIHEHPTNAMVEFLSAGVKHRRQPLIFMITNSGSDRQTVCWEYHSYGVQICSGAKKNDEFFAYICALDKGDDPFEDESCWIKANPSLPTIPGLGYIRAEVRKAKGMRSKENLVRRLNFCQWTDAADAWISKDIWTKVQFKLDLKEYEGQECYGGLDLSQSSDLTAFALVFPTGHRKWDAFSWFWMPGDRLRELEDRDSMAPLYSEWKRDGYLQAPSGKTIDYEHAAHLLAELCSRFNVKAIAYDRAKIDVFKDALDKAGADDLPLIEHGQGFYKAKATGLWIPGSLEEFEGALIEGRIRVNENPVLSWNVACAVTQASNIQPTDRYFSKRKATGRIDGVLALTQALGAATMLQKPPMDVSDFLANAVMV